MSTAIPVPLPLPPSASSPSQVPVVADDRAISALIELLLERSGLPKSEVAERLGVARQSLHQYHRTLTPRRPSLKWLCKLAAVCGASLVIQFDPK